METEPLLDSALAEAWHQESAHSSLERWLEVRKKECWGNIPDDLPLLIKVFGASWYFTRYIFYRGKEAALLVDNTDTESFQIGDILRRFEAVKKLDDPERRLDRLRLLKNEIMLQILIRQLADQLTQQQVEQALTNLSDATLFTAMDIFDLHSLADARIAALGMGRMAGYEMTFGSDLDLIFLFESPTQDSAYELSKKIRLLLRYLPIASSAGALYDVDMRLRPHGTSGALLTSVNSFLEYHQSDCEIWERQMMTRCRAVVDENGLGKESLQKIMPDIYADYDEEFLRREIVSMRKRVEDEKGNIKGKYEVKRGRGGLMDIDFLTHFLQLNNGQSIDVLHTCSTRTALRVSSDHNLLSKTTAQELLEAYDFLKTIESCVRLFDMKPVSTISATPEANVAVARAMGFGGKTDEFMDKYREVTTGVRKQFTELLGDPDEKENTE